MDCAGPRSNQRANHGGSDCPTTFRRRWTADRDRRLSSGEGRSIRNLGYRFLGSCFRREGEDFSAAEEWGGGARIRSVMIDHDAIDAAVDEIQGRQTDNEPQHPRPNDRPNGTKNPPN